MSSVAYVCGICVLRISCGSDFSSWQHVRNADGFSILAVKTLVLKKPLTFFCYYFKLLHLSENTISSTEMVYEATVYEDLPEDPNYYNEGAMDDEFDSQYNKNALPSVVGDSSKVLRTGSVSQLSTQAFDDHLNNQLLPLDVSFQSVVKHTVSAVVTWKVPCYDNPKSPVKYMVRYYPAESPEVYTDKSTPTNFVLLDNLRPNHIYKYQVRRMTKDNEDSDWSKAGILDTNYPNGDS